MAVKNKRITRKDLKNLIIGTCLIAVALLLGATQAQAADGQNASSGRFLTLKQASQSSASGSANFNFRPIGEIKRNVVASKPIPLNGDRPRIKPLNHPSIKHRVAEMDVQKEKAAKPEALPETHMAARPAADSILPRALEPMQDFLPRVTEPMNKAPISQQPDDGMMSYIWPIESNGRKEISSNFGPRKHPITGKRDFHAGIDIPAAKGTPVIAAADGEVTGVGTHPRLGRYVKITHADGTYALYGHLQNWSTKEGRRVKAGDRIGKVGSTGRSTGPHLDFSIRRDGKPMDPLPLLAQALGKKTLAMFN